MAALENEYTEIPLSHDPNSNQELRGIVSPSKMTADTSFNSEKRIMSLQGSTVMR